jgi:hypothetical protein
VRRIDLVGEDILIDSLLDDPVETSQELPQLFTSTTNQQMEDRFPRIWVQTQPIGPVGFLSWPFVAPDFRVLIGDINPGTLSGPTARGNSHP